MAPARVYPQRDLDTYQGFAYTRLDIGKCSVLSSTFSGQFCCREREGGNGEKGMGCEGLMISRFFHRWPRVRDEVMIKDANDIDDVHGDIRGSRREL